MIKISFYKKVQNKLKSEDGMEEKIPKIIHYIWIGNNEKPEKVKECIKSWKKYMSDYKIIEWNENNFNIGESNYALEAYKNKKWAFVSDYMRFKILYDFGGIYLDTDVEFLRKLPKEILDNNSFTGVEFSKKIAPGLIYGCCKHDKIAKYMIDQYERIKFDNKNIITVNEVITKYLKKFNFKEDNTFQIIEDLAIYPDDFFCGYDQDVNEIKITKNTITVHHYLGTWCKKGIKHKLQYYIKKIFGIETYRKMLYLKRRVGKIGKKERKNNL